MIQQPEIKKQNAVNAVNKSENGTLETNAGA